MKRKYLYPGFVLSIFFLSSCFYGDFNMLTGDGNVVTESREVGDFHGIEAAAGLQVYVSFGEMSNIIEVEADENLQNHIITVVEGGILKIKTRTGIRRAEAKNIYVSAGDIDYLEASSAAGVYGENLLVTGSIDLEVSSAAKIDVRIEADEMDIEMSSSAGADISGKASKLWVEVSSAANLRAEDLEVADCDINVSSAGDARIFVTGELSAVASSAGNIKYKGEPEVVRLETSSAGNISPLR